MKNPNANPRFLTLSSCAFLLIAVMLGNEFITTVVGCAIFPLGSGLGMRRLSWNGKQRESAVCLAIAGAALAVTIWSLRGLMETV